MVLSDIFKRMKWGFIPIRRSVDEDENEPPIESRKSDGGEDPKSFKDTPTVVTSTSDNTADPKASPSEIIVTDLYSQSYEYRDEKDRKWWKFFDEMEYRVQTGSKEKRKWYRWFHDNDTPEEKRVLWKLDLSLALYALLSYWISCLDQINLTNAYIGGLKDAIDMVDNDFVNTTVMFNVGNIIFQIPFMYILYALPLTYVIPLLDVAWSLLTIFSYKVTTVAQLKAIRFFIGGVESSLYVAYHSLFASWYKSSTGEVTRRTGFFYFGQYLGNLTSGVLSGAIERHLDGYDGHQAWQWIFIVEGIVSVFIGLLGFYMLPGTPEDCYSAFLSDDEIRVARRRMRDDQKDSKPRENVVKYFFDKELWISIFTSWQVYVVTIWCTFLWNNSNDAAGAYPLWLQSLTDKEGNPRFNAGQLQDYTALTPALGLLWVVITCCIADLLESRWAAIVFSQVFNVVGNIILAVWEVPEGAKWFAWCLQFFGWAMSPTLYAWQGDICRKDIRARSVILVIMNMMAQQSTAWVAVLVWKTVEAPRFLKGYTFTAACGFGSLVWTFVVLWFYKRQERSEAKDNGIILFNSEVDGDYPPSLDDFDKESHKK